MNKDIESFQGENLEESEMGQVHALHLNENAIAAIRRRISTEPSLEECIDCGCEIPKERRLAATGCIRCIHCETAVERKRF
jgi:RNA polymerase-binding transcription factor DksA